MADDFEIKPKALAPNLVEIPLQDTNQILEALSNPNGSILYDSDGSIVFKDIKVGGATTQYKISNSGVFSFGDGSDGAATISSGTTTLTSDKYYTDLTIDGTGTLNPAGYRVFCTGTLTLGGTGKISGNGNDGVDGLANGSDTSAPAALADGYLKGAVAGGIGGRGGNSGQDPNNGGTGPNTSNSLGDNGSAGGDGGDDNHGDSQSPGTGGAGGTATASNVKLIANWHLAVLLDIASSGSTVKYDNSAVAGGGGGGTRGAPGSVNGGSGGSGGTAGRIVAIYARNIVIGASASITANGGAGGDGGNGANGSTDGAGGGGGAGAGNGGQIILVYNTLENIGSLTVSAGTAGAGGTGGTGSNSNGDAGDVGTAGSVGTVRLFQLSL